MEEMKASLVPVITLKNEQSKATNPKILPNGSSEAADYDPRSQRKDRIERNKKYKTRERYR